MPNDNIIFIAKGLNNITTNGTIAITEAGRLPYYSKWHAVDTWGLNTSKYSKNLIQPKDIEVANFDLIVVHAARNDYSQLLNLDNLPTLKTRTWFNMSNNIFKGIDMEEYILYMVPYHFNNENNILINLSYNIERIRYKIKHKPNNINIERYDAYFLKKSFKYSLDVEELLKRNNSIKFNEYLKLIKKK